MPYRKLPFVNNEIYHVIARGVAKKPIFISSNDYYRAFELIDFYRRGTLSLRFSYFSRLPKKKKEEFLKRIGNIKPVVEILAFCLMSNHLHFLLRQLEKRGISIFMSNFQNSYAKYFNLRHKRIGPLFQPMFKAVRIEDDEQLVHVSRYIHLNPVSSYLIEIEELEDYPWSSFGVYLGKRKLEFVEPNLILDYFGKREKYRQFVFDQADYQRELEKIKHLILEQ